MSSRKDDRLVSWLLDVFVAIEEFFGLNVGNAGKRRRLRRGCVASNKCFVRTQSSFGQLVAETVLAAVFRFRCKDFRFSPMCDLAYVASFATGNGPVAGGSRGLGITHMPS